MKRWKQVETCHWPTWHPSAHRLPWHLLTLTEGCYSGNGAGHDSLDVAARVVAKPTSSRSRALQKREFRLQVPHRRSATLRVAVLQQSTRAPRRTSSRGAATL